MTGSANRKSFNMDQPSVYDPPRYGFKIIGWGLFLAMLPFALAGSVPYDGKYRELGIDTPDCNLTSPVFFFAVPALVIYFPGLIINVIRWRENVINRIAAGACLIFCLSLSINIIRDNEMQRIDRDECQKVT